MPRHHHYKQHHSYSHNIMEFSYLIVFWIDRFSILVPPDPRRVLEATNFTFKNKILVLFYLKLKSTVYLTAAQLFHLTLTDVSSTHKKTKLHEELVNGN